MSRGKAKIVEMFSSDAPNPAALRAAHWRTTDIANAAAFIDQNGHRLRFTHRGAGWQ